MPGEVLVGVDGSDGSWQALRWAAREAAARQALLRPVLAWQSPQDFGDPPGAAMDEAKVNADATDRLGQVLAGATAGYPAVRTGPLAVHGDPAQLLCARSADAAVLVVGARGQGGFAGLLLGSVSMKCAHHSQSPLVIVRPHGQATGTGTGTGEPAPVRRIRVGFDGSRQARRALGWAIAEAALHGAAVEAVQMWHDPFDEDMGLEYQAPYFRWERRTDLEHVEEELARAVSELAGEYPAVTVSPVLLEGDPAQTLCHQSADADLLVVGSRGHGGFARLILGSVSSACAHHSRCPIAIVPGPAAGTGTTGGHEAPGHDRVK